MLSPRRLAGQLVLFCCIVAATYSSSAAEALFSFEQTTNGVFDVFFSLEGDDTLGLSTAVVDSNNLADFGIDNTGVSFTPANLSNVRAGDFQPVGFNSFLDTPVGNKYYTSAYSQFNATNPIFGIGQTPVFAPAAPGLPGNEDIELGVPALIGRLDLGTWPAIENLHHRL